MKLFSRNTKTVELWVVWDDDCNVVADMDRDEARQRLEMEHGPFARELKLTLSIPAPEPIEATLTIDDDTQTASIKVGR